VDKIGRTAMVIASGVTLFLAGLFSALALTDSILMLTITLSLLGLGWNFGLMSGITLIFDVTDLSTRAKTQGYVDVLMVLA
jgi:MFS family permease